MITDHIEVTIDDLFIEHYEPGGEGVPTTSATMKAMKEPRATRGRVMRIVPHPKSFLGAGIIGVGLLVAGLLVYKRWFA